MISLIPIAQSQIDWNTFLKETSTSLGRSATAGLDKRRMPINQTLSDFICILREIESPGIEPFGLAGQLLSHIHMSFLMFATDSATLSVVTKTRLIFTVVPTKINNFQLSIISGTLHEWRAALLNCLSPDIAHIQDIRVFGSLALKHFEKANLQRYMLSGINQTVYGDGTIRLIEER